MDVNAYLKRIGVEKPTVLNKETLDMLIRAHQCTVPFEDLECNYLKKRVSLDPDVLFDKIVNKGRGGYCFELNYIFKDFLVALGFDAFNVFCRVRSMERPVMHRGIFVRFQDGLYYADVGFGGPMPFGSVKLEDGLKQDVAGETFWFDKTDDYWWHLSRISESGEEESALYMTTQPQTDIEFESMNYYCSTNPEGRFVSLTLVNLRLPDGYYSITDRTFTIKKGSEKQEKEITSDEEFRSILSEYFSINL